MIFEKIFQKIFVFKDKRLDPGDFFFWQQLKSQTVFSDFETKSAKKCATRTTGLTFVLKDDSDSDIECFWAVEEEYETVDTANSGMHTNDQQNQPDEFGRV